MRLLSTFLIVGLVISGSGVQAEQLELDNGIIRVGADLDYGGAITYLSLSGEERNLINNHDRGRQVQQSYYTGEPLDRRDEGQHPSWSPWPWNPIQVGDVYFNPAEVIEHQHSDEEIYTKTIPMLWDMDNEPAECHFETWISLDGNTVIVRNKLTTFRTDDRWSATPRHQELPAVYTIADLPHLYTYDGDAPFTRDALTRIPPTPPPWTYWDGTEKWAAYVDDDNWGVGVYYADAEEFIGGFAGSPGGGTMDASTGYISPLRTMAIEKDTVFEYEYTLIVGNLDEIRDFVYIAEGHTVDQPPSNDDENDEDNGTLPPDTDMPVRWSAGVIGAFIVLVFIALFVMWRIRAGHSS